MRLLWAKIKRGYVKKERHFNKKGSVTGMSLGVAGLFVSYPILRDYVGS